VKEREVKLELLATENSGMRDSLCWPPVDAQLRDIAVGGDGGAI